MANHKMMLTLDLVEADFGPATRAVCDVLLQRSSCTLDELARLSGIDKSLVKECLMAGIQHNFILPLEEVKESSKKSQDGAQTVYTSYRIIPENVLIRMRFTRFSFLARTKYSEWEDFVVCHFMEYGRSTVGNTLDHLVNQEEYHYSMESTLSAFKKLKDAGFLILAPQLNDGKIPCRSLKVDELTASGNEADDIDTAIAGRGKKRAQPGSRSLDERESNKPSKKIAKSTAVPKTSLTTLNKKSGQLDMAPEMRLYDSFAESRMMDISSTTSASIHDKASVSSSSMATSVPSSKAARPSYTTVDLESDENKYCLDFDRFNREHCKEACICYVGDKIDVAAAFLMREMFEINETVRTIGEDRLWNIISNRDNLKAQDIMKSLTREKMKNYLDHMSKGKVPFLIRITSPQGFMINIKNIVQSIKEKIVESIVFDKFGQDSLRIFRLLQIKKMLDQKQVSELAMTPVKETRDLLYKMLQHNYVHLQEVPRTTEHIPSKTFYLWSVKWQQVLLIIESDLYKAIRNMKMRLQFTTESRKDVLSKFYEQVRVNQANEGGERLDIMSPTEKAQLNQVQLVTERLDNAVFQLDETLMILVDF